MRCPNIPLPATGYTPVHPKGAMPGIPGGGVGISFYFGLTKKRWKNDPHGIFWFGYSIPGTGGIPARKGELTRFRPGNYKWYLTWNEVKALISDLFMDISQDPVLVDTMIQMDLMPLIPVRSGHLASSIFGSMTMYRKQWYGSHFYGYGVYSYPVNRPAFIPGRVRHIPPDEGYGEFGPQVNQSYFIPNVTVKYVTPGGGLAMYILNDPTSDSEPKKVINRIFKNMIRSDYHSKFRGIIVGVELK